MSKTYGLLSALKLLQISAYDDRLGHAARRVLTLISGHSDKHGACFPSLTQIAKRLRYSRAAIRNQVRNLEKYGYIKSTSRSCPETGATRSNLYQLNLALAREHEDDTHVFCAQRLRQHPVNSESMPPETSNNNPPIEHPDVTASVTLRNNPKKPEKENNIKKPNKITKKQSLGLQNANNWQRSKEYEEKTGITPQNKKDMERATENLKKHRNHGQMTELNLRLQKETAGMQKKEAFLYILQGIKEELEKIKTNKIIYEE